VFFLLAASLVFLMLIDISNSNYYRLQLVESQKEAMELSQVKQRFLANMSHEIRTPLQSIIGFREQLQFHNHDDDSVKSIHRASRHLLQLVNEILDYNRIESGILSIEQKPFDLNTVVKEVADSTSILAKKKGLTFNCCTQELPEIMVQGDAFRLKQILFNLISNAVKFTSQGNVTLKVKAQIDQKVICQFMVSDTGMGMVPEELNRVFNEFEQAHSGIHEKFGGSGLGLTLVRKLTSLLKGKISVSSEPGKGSVFTVEIPFEKVQGPLSSLHVDDSITLQSSDEHVAIVDDDSLLLKLYEVILKKHQVKHTIFNSPQQAIQFDFAKTSIVFIDIRMPELDGRELARVIRNKHPQGFPGHRATNQSCS
jgi:signal transduction histidine kinase